MGWVGGGGWDQKLQSVAKLVTHSAKFWNLLDELRTTAKKYTGTMVITCLVNIAQGGGGGDVLPRIGILENSPKTVIKVCHHYATDCSRLDFDPKKVQRKGSLQAAY